MPTRLGFLYKRLSGGSGSDPFCSLLLAVLATVGAAMTNSLDIGRL